MAMGGCMLKDEIKISSMKMRDSYGVNRLRKVLHHLTPGKEMATLHGFILHTCFVLSCIGILRRIIYRTYPWFSFTALVAKNDDKVVGVVWLQGTGNKGIADVGIIVLPEYQGQGIGTMLYNKSEELAVSIGVKRIEASCGIGNYKNLNLLKKRGYIVTRTYLGKDL